MLLEARALVFTGRYNFLKGISVVEYFC